MKLGLLNVGVMIEFSKDVKMGWTVLNSTQLVDFDKLRGLIFDRSLTMWLIRLCMYAVFMLWRTK